jgi:N6-L-threonylcarbamoyladenine synthase
MILALESSCDETAVALFSPDTGLAGEWISSQVATHARHGGVVPDLAAREHLRNFGPLLRQAQAEVGFGAVRQVAVTHGPGLAPCLALGLAAAQALGRALHLPVAGVNHLRGHVWSAFLPVHAENPAEFSGRLAALLPHLGLIVSGGNTLLFTLDHSRGVTVLAATRDDAAGEALDKGAKLLGLGYPGGPLIENAARGGRVDAFEFPRGIGPRHDLGFSFSGLKTSLRYRIEKMGPAEVGRNLPDLCAGYQEAVVDALARKTALALEQGGGVYRSLGLSGGVANNGPLRERLAALARRNRVTFLPARPGHTGDNAGMIAFAAWADPAGRPGESLQVVPGLSLESA